ncbi:UNVERIFIED_CONTAM: putative cell survival pathways protein [Siphonaria sp. JEL0065]|nr:putative cell survival pathways protein [Siphonaria sp. JEL0065]
MLSFGKKSVATTITTKNVPVTALPNPQPGSYARSDIRPSVKNNASEDDLKWQLISSNATETQTFYMSLDGGNFAFVQMAYSTMGLTPNIGLTCRVYQRDGTKEGKTINHGPSAFKTSDNKMSVTCEQMSIKYNPATNGYAVQFALSKETFVDVDFTPLEPAFKINDGKILFAKTEKDGFVLTQFMPKAVISGTVSIGGKSFEAKGQGLFHHAVLCKPQCAYKWNFINFQNEDDALMLHEFDMTQKGNFDVSIVSQGCLVRNNHSIAITTNNRAVHVQRQLDSTSGYEVPTQAFISWQGKTLEDNLDVSVEISTLLSNKLDTIDVLAELPYLLRKFIQTFITAPYLFSWYEKVVAKVTIGDEVSEMEGNMFMECTFLAKE